MNAHKLDSWLVKSGLTTRASQNTTSDPKKTQKKKSDPKRSSKSVSTKTAHTGKHTQSSSSSSRSKKPALKPSKPTTGAFASAQGYNPMLGRPTFEKREKFHPTNFLKSPNVGDIRVVPLGGMEQVGFNMMFIEWGDDIIILDAGSLFPSVEHLGIDLLIPDVSYLIQNKKKIRGILITHGHLDHIGALQYIMKDLGFPPIYSSRLTKELIMANYENPAELRNVKIHDVTPKSKVKLGRFECEFFHMNHSIPENLGICVNTPYGAIVHSSDFKIDHNPSDDMPADLTALSKIGSRGVALAMVDSTNATKAGQTLSESVIERTLEKVVEKTRGRLIVTTFASNIGRLAKVIEAAEKNGRTVFLSGRSMERNIAIAKKLNYLKCKEKTLQRMNRKANTMPPGKVLILSTGSQGEELAALTRMAAGVHKEIQLSDQDNIIFSSSTIPGNELAIVSVLNNLAKIGCRIIDKKELDVYVSGHGNKEELKLFTSLINPKYFAPIHGEVFMRYAHQDMIIKELGYNPRHTFIMNNGQGIILNKKGARLMTEKEKLVVKPVMIELSETVGEHILAERTQMSDDGTVFVHIDHQKGSVKSIDIRSRGFVYMAMQQDIFKLLKTELKQAFEKHYDPARSEKALETTLQKIAEKVLLQKFRKEPLVEVII